MNQQWLTTFMSNVRSQLESQLQSRGVRLNPTDLAALVEEISPKASHAALSYMVDWVRPFTAGMGLRVSRFSDTRIELILPPRARNLNENKEIHEGALLAGTLEGARLLWERHAPVGDFKMRTLESHLRAFKPASGELRLRLELPETLRESVLAEIRQQRRARLEMQAQIYDDKDQAVAEVDFQLEFAHTPELGTSARD